MEDKLAVDGGKPIRKNLLRMAKVNYGYEELFKSKPPDYTFKNPGEALQWIIKKELKNDWC